MSAQALPNPMASVVDFGAGARAQLGSARLRRMFHQVLRFALVGGSGTAAYILLYLALAGVTTDLLANAIAWFVTTVATNSLQRHYAFGAERSGGIDDAVGLVTSLAALGATTVLLAVLTTSSAAAAVAVLVLVNTAVGAIRFLVLHYWFDRHALNAG